MNDCIWVFVGACNCPRRCNEYISANSQSGNEFLEEYREKIEEAIKPVKEMYKQKFESL